MGTTISGDTGITFPDATTQSKAVSQTTPFAVTASATTGAQLNLPEGTNNGAHFVALKAPNVLAADTTFTLPAADGTTGQFLQTNGAGALAFASVAPGGTTGQVQVNNAGVFGAVAEGTAGQVLTSGGAGVAPTFAAPSVAWTVISSVTPTVGQTNVNFSSIPQTYTDLLVVIVGASHNGGTAQQLRMQGSFNNGSTQAQLNIGNGVQAGGDFLYAAHFIAAYTTPCPIFFGAGNYYSSTAPGSINFNTANSPSVPAALALGTGRTLNWLNFNWSNNAFDAGTITLYGR